MPRNNDRGTSSNSNTRRAPKDTGRRIKKKPCAICKDRIAWVDYKDVNMLRKYMSDRGKIRARRVSGNCAQHQRDVALAIKTARELVLLPYTQRTTTERPGGRGGRGGRGDRDGGFSGGQGGSGRGRPRSDSDEEQGKSSGAGSAPAGDTVAAPAGESATGADAVATDAAGEDAAMTTIATEAEAEVVGAESEG
jgi:small subunit ribosomal protein S18